MNEKDFCYWLQGFVELQDSDVISEKQWLVIKDHLKLVFDKETPDHNNVSSQPFTFKVSDVQAPFDFKKASDFIGKHYEPTDFGPPYTITC